MRILKTGRGSAPKFADATAISSFIVRFLPYKQSPGTY